MALDDHRQEYGCPPDINFRFWLFALATGAEIWESNADYCCWIQGMKYREASEKAGAVCADNGHGYSSAAQVDAYMAAGIPIPTPEQITKAHRYFGTMPSRQESSQ